MLLWLDLHGRRNKAPRDRPAGRSSHFAEARRAGLAREDGTSG